MADISKIKIEDGTYNIKDETARSLIADLQVPKNYFAGRKFILIGDSYAVGEDGSGGIITSWEQLFIDYTGIDSSNVIKKAQGGAGFVNLGSNKNFQTLLEEVSSSDEITDIVVLGGYNDRSYNSTQIKNAINSFRISANTRFPNAKIHVGYIGRCKIATNLYKIEESIGFYKDSCQYQAIHYLDGIEYSLHEYYSNFGDDGVHPNNIGQIYITFNLIQALIGGSVQRQFNFKNINITPSSGITLANASAIGCMMKGNVIEVSNQDDNFRILFEPSITINPSRTYWIEIGTMTTGYIWGSNYNMSLIPVRLITNSTEGYIESSGLIKFSGGKIYVGLGFHIDPSTGAYRKFTNLTEIKIDAFHGVLLSDFC